MGSIKSGVFFFMISFLVLGISCSKSHNGHLKGKKVGHGEKVGHGNENGHGKGHDKGHETDVDGQYTNEILKMNFYQNSCPEAESLVREITWNHTAADPFMGARLLRLHYHDCFVRGCDASLLLESTKTSKAEKQARPNLSLTGYEVIDEIKTKIEQKCPITVSCADILALAARDAVSFEFRDSQPNLWEVFTGRRDGRVSLETEAITDLPSASSNFTTLLDLFERKGLNSTDLVVLSGAHTIGIARCVVISRRLFNFTGKGDTDPSIDPDYAEFLKSQCSNPPNPGAVEMDPESSISFDSHYYRNLNQKKGLFQSDASLLTNPSAKILAKSLENPFLFFDLFGSSMKNMGAMQVLTGEDGEIRKNCHFVN